jgi:hypothetical protein
MTQDIAQAVLNGRVHVAARSRTNGKTPTIHVGNVKVHLSAGAQVVLVNSRQSAYGLKNHEGVSFSFAEVVRLVDSGTFVVTDTPQKQNAYTGA